MKLLQQFQEYIKANDLFSPKDKLLLAVSGGVDSVVLCDLCKKAGYDFAMAHCNFQLRGEESERDEQFVKKLGNKYGVEVFVKRFDTKKYAAENKLSTQEAARDLRYSWFKELLAPDSRLTTPDFLLTAHHADDNIETMAMKFFRGTGVKGLRGMLPKNGKLVRPLLFARKKQLEEYAGVGQIKFVTDQTNFENDYTRNFFRNRVIPLLKDVYPAAEENLIDNIERFSDVEQLYEQAIALHKKKLVEKKGNEFHIPVLKLKKSAPLRSIVYEIIRDFNFTARQTEDVIGLLDSETGKYVASPTHRVIRNRNWLIITPLALTESQNILIEEGIGNMQWTMGNLQIKTAPIADCQLPIVNSEANLDLDEIKFPLLLRKWKQGDYFYPLGMKKIKKLARFFIDQKLSKIEKEKIWVIESNKRIIWVIGLRIDERFKITDKTKSCLKLSFIPPE